MNTGKPYSEACERNREPILEVLRKVFADCKSVLEIGSGTGQHAVYFGAHLPHLTWQTGDVPANHPGILAWLEEARLPNVLRPLALDVNAARDFENVDALARSYGFGLERDFAMPANNRTLVWRRLSENAG